MAHNNGAIGGFVAKNSGSIKNAYSVLKIRGKGKLAAGFAAENSGTIAESYCFGSLNHLTGGFVATDNGHTEEKCYFLHTEKEGGKRLQKLSDSSRGQRADEIKDNETLAALGFDTQAVWKYMGTDIPWGFIPERWMYHYQREEKEPVFIEHEQELLDFAARVNQGDAAAVKGYVVLKEDIDLGGREWVPIGDSRVNAFCGVFDGAGHTVKNFVIKDKKRENKGFFGFLKGQVYNLSVDCIIKNGICIGGLVSQNEGGVIGCCSAVVEIGAKQGIAGGLVGRNTGEIFQSYAAGKITALIIPIWWGLAPAGLLLFLLLIPAVKPGGLLPVFAPVPYDEDQVPIENEVIAPNTDGNFVSFQFKQEIEVALNTGLCSFEFKNPGNSNHNIVVQLQFTDAQAVRVMGSTGRSPKEQEKLERTPGYDPETYRTVIAESGAIRPGYQLEDLKLVTHADGATLPVGSYNAMVYLVFYDIDTNNRAMLESQLPVVIEVKDFI